MQIDREAPLRFLKAAFLPGDWIAVLLKRHDTGEVIQRVGSLDMALAPRFQSWLRFKNARGFSVFVSVNTLTPGRRSRTRESVRAVRHVFSTRIGTPTESWPPLTVGQTWPRHPS